MNPTFKVRQANDPVTAETFARLPLLLRAAEVLWATGYTRNELADAVKAGQIHAVPNVSRNTRQKNGRKVKCKTNYNKYTKTSVAKLLGFTC